MNTNDSDNNRDARALDTEIMDQERYEFLHRLEDWLETPMLVLAFLWLALLIQELIQGEIQLFLMVGTIIWLSFILDFAVKLILAPKKLAYLKSNWLTAISLLVPALRRLPPSSSVVTPMVATPNWQMPNNWPRSAMRW
jgi:voltage-gated potassium channel